VDRGDARAGTHLRLSRAAVDVVGEPGRLGAGGRGPPGGRGGVVAVTLVALVVLGHGGSGGFELGDFLSPASRVWVVIIYRVRVRFWVGSLACGDPCRRGSSWRFESFELGLDHHLEQSKAVPWPMISSEPTGCFVALELKSSLPALVSQRVLSWKLWRF
jgi:hypothetical protein